jgi:hypothetical protein
MNQDALARLSIHITGWMTDRRENTHWRIVKRLYAELCTIFGALRHVSFLFVQVVQNTFGKFFSDITLQPRFAKS